jgi:hypothetical protein
MLALEEGSSWNMGEHIGAGGHAGYDRTWICICKALSIVVVAVSHTFPKQEGKMDLC